MKQTATKALYNLSMKLHEIAKQYESTPEFKALGENGKIQQKHPRGQTVFKPIINTSKQFRSTSFTYSMDDLDKTPKN